MSNLFEPFQLAGVEFKNRIAVSPMWQYRGQKGFPTDWHLVHLGRMAVGGAALVIQEGTGVERRGCGTVGDLGLWDDKFIAPLRRITDFIRQQGAVPGIQIMHAGRKAKAPLYRWDRHKPMQRTPDIEDWDDWEVIGPTDQPHTPVASVPRAMTVDDIDAVVEAFGAATRRAVLAGYETIDVHSAHGYLLHQFLSEASNTRTDDYGGSFENRTRFARRVIGAVREAWPEDKPLLVRISVEDYAGWTVEETVRFAGMLKTLGVSALDCSAGGFTPKWDREVGLGYQVHLSEAIRRRVGLPTLAVGLIVDPHQADGIIRSGAADMVALGRELLYNPNWPIDAAQRLACDPDFSVAPATHAHPLVQRTKALAAHGKAVVRPVGPVFEQIPDRPRFQHDKSSA